MQRRHVRGEVSGVHTLDTKDANIALFDTRCAIVNWLSPQQTGRFGNSPSLARSTATGLAIKHRADADAADRQKLTPIRPKFGLNNVSARFHCVPAISQPRSCWGHFRCQGGQLPGGTGDGGGRTVRREIVSRSLSGFVARCGFGIRRFDSNFSTKLCISFGSTADFSVRPTSLLGSFIYRIQRNARRPVTAAPTAKCY